LNAGCKKKKKKKKKKKIGYRSKGRQVGLNFRRAGDRRNSPKLGEVKNLKGTALPFCASKKVSSALQMQSRQCKATRNSPTPSRSLEGNHGRHL
jgi:hypothetical protein